MCPWREGRKLVQPSFCCLFSTRKNIMTLQWLFFHSVFFCRCSLPELNFVTKIWMFSNIYSMLIPFTGKSDRWDWAKCIAKLNLWKPLSSSLVNWIWWQTMWSLYMCVLCFNIKSHKPLNPISFFSYTGVSLHCNMSSHIIVKRIKYLLLLTSN